MTTQDIMTAISTIGFPIAMCLVVCWYVYTKDKDHKDEIDKLSEAVNSQTLNIQKLIDKIDQLISREDENNA